jgi:hypothetical protein
MARGLRKWSKTASNNANADGGINWAEGMAPSAVNDSARAEMASMSMWRDDNNGSLAGALSTATYAVTSNQTFDALAAGDTIAFQLGADMPAAPLLNVDGLGAKPLRPVPGTDFAGGEYLANQVVRAAYMTSNAGEWIVIGHRKLGAEPNAIVTANIANAAVTYAKMQNVAGNRLLGNPTGSAAAPSETPVSGNLFFNGSALVGGASRGYIDGLTLSQGSSTTLGIAAGICRDDANSVDIALASAMTKSTASWAVGSGNGGLDTGTIAINTWYYAYAIYRTDTNVGDVLFTATYGSPTLPANYTKKRYIGAFKTDGSSHVPLIIQRGGLFYYFTMASEFAGTPTDTNGHVINITVPPSVVVRAILSVGSDNNILIAITDPATSDTAVSNSFFTQRCGSSGGGGVNEIWTNTSAQVRYRVSTSGTLYINTLGYFDPRGANA